VKEPTPLSYLDLLKDRTDIRRVPFSDRGSRLMVFRAPQPNSLARELSERIGWLHPGLDAYRRRPPFIRDLHLVNERGGLNAAFLDAVPRTKEIQ
jgi:hypothetical protein